MELGSGANATDCNETNNSSLEPDIDALYENVTAPHTTSEVIGLEPYKCYGFQVRAVVEFNSTLLPGDLSEERRDITDSTSKT